jgi:hypothetical protein
LFHLKRGAGKSLRETSPVTDWAPMAETKVPREKKLISSSWDFG